MLDIIHGLHDDHLTRYTNILNDLPYPINEEDRERDPEIDNTTNTVHYWKRKLKHDFVRPIDLYVKFQKNRVPHTFQIGYYINASNNPKPKKGYLTIVIKERGNA